MSSSNIAGIWQRLPNEQSTPTAGERHSQAGTAAGKLKQPFWSNNLHQQPHQPSPFHSAHISRDSISSGPKSNHTSPLIGDRHSLNSSPAPRSLTPSSRSHSTTHSSPARSNVGLPSGLVAEFTPSSPARTAALKGLYSDTADSSLQAPFLRSGPPSSSSSVAGPFSAAPPASQTGATSVTPTAALLSPPLSQEPESKHTQATLAEIFVGNPRPHYRSPSLNQSLGLPDLSRSPVTPSSPSKGLIPSSTSGYFSAPSNNSRTRSYSSASVLDRTAVPSPANDMTSSTNNSPFASLSRSNSLAAAGSRNGEADQYGYRPSNSLASSQYSASLPVSIPKPIRMNSTSAIPGGAIEAGSLGGYGESASPGSRTGMSGFGPASYSSNTGSAFEQTGWRSNKPVRQSSFNGWEDMDRHARPGSRNDDSRNVGWGERDASVSSTGTGIGLSNMSPFTRDGRALFPDPQAQAESVYRTRREYSLGAVGSGRKRGESVWGVSRPLREAEDEDADDGFAVAKSGATSRRHSVAAFNAPSRTQIGFNVGSEDQDDKAGDGGSRGKTLPTRGVFGKGNSAIDDDDLAADLNSLHLNLEAHAAATEERDRHYAPVGSMPSHYPQSRPFDSTAPQSPSSAFSPTSPTAGGDASRLFQAPGQSNASRGSSRFDFGGIGSGNQPSQNQGKPFQAFQNGFPSFGSINPGSQFPPSQPFGQPPPQNFFSQPLPPPGLQPPFPTLAPQAQLQQQVFYTAGPAPPVLSPGLGDSQNQELANLGRGIPLHSVPADTPLYIVEFKAGRKDLFFVEDPNLQLRQGDLVIVEADRGKDIGKFFKPCSLDEVQAFQQRLVEMALGQLANPGAGQAPNPASIARMTKEFAPKKIFGKAQAADTQMLLSKAQDEVKALQLIRSKVVQKNLPMEVCDAEWQWDRRKLTFYFTLQPGHTRVDFRELVRELFRIFKTRLWLCSLDQQASTWDFK